MAIKTFLDFELCLAYLMSLLLEIVTTVSAHSDIRDLMSGIQVQLLN